MKAKKYLKGGKVKKATDPRNKYSTMPQTPEEIAAFKEMMRRKNNEISPSAPVGGEAQRTKKEEQIVEEMRIESMRESLLEGEGMKALQEYDRELMKKGYSFPNGSSIKNVMMGGGKMPKYGKGGMMKYLKGGQMKLDANKDGKISGLDFAMLRKMKK